MAVAEQLPRDPLPRAVALDEGLQGAHELAAVGALALLDRGEDGVAEQAQRVVVLEREQELEGAEVAVGREPPGARAVAVAVLAPDRQRLERAARLVVGAARAGGRGGPPRPAGGGAAAGGPPAGPRRLGEREGDAHRPRPREGPEHAGQRPGGADEP